MKLELKNIQKSALPETSGFLVSLITGFNPYEAWSIGSKLLTTLRTDQTWLDWEGKEIDIIYTNERHKLFNIDVTENRLLFPQVVLFDNTKLKKTLNEFKIEINQEKPDFQAQNDHTSRNSSIIEYYKQLKRSIFSKQKVTLYDWDCARLFQFNDETRTFTFQKSKYYDYLKTNLAMDHKSNAINSLREEIHKPYGKLHPLNLSPFANHLGINFLILTDSGEFLIPKRSKKVLIRPDELSPSVSGALDYQDIFVDEPKCMDTIDISREIREELTIEISNSIEQIHLLGITRELIRGGKPELFLLAKSKMSKNQISESINKGSKSEENSEINFISINPYHKEILNMENITLFQSNFLGLIKQLDMIGKISVPLFTNLAFFYKYKTNNPQG